MSKKDPLIFIEHIMENINDIPVLKKQIEKIKKDLTS